MHDQLRGRLCVLAAAVLWSTSGLLVKSPLLAALPIEHRGPLIACFRALFACACLLPFVRPSRVRMRPLLLPLIGCFALMNFAFTTAMTLTTAAAAVFLQYTGSVWAFVFGVLWLGERAERSSLLALGGAVCGIIWIVAGDWNAAHLGGNLLALVSGLAYAGVIVSLRVLRDEDGAWLVALSQGISGLVLLPWALSGPLPTEPTAWLTIALLGAAQMAAPYVLFARGVRLLSVQEACLLPLIEPVLGPLWVWLAWGEQPASSTWIGGGLILGSLALRYLVLPPASGPKAGATVTTGPTDGT